MKNPPNIGLLIVDDKEMVRLGLRVFLSGYPNIAIIGECDTGESAFEFIKQHHQEVDVVLMDLDMPGRGGIHATRMIREAYDDVAVIIITLLDNQFREFGMRAGAHRVMSKLDDDEELIAEIMRAAQSL